MTIRSCGGSPSVWPAGTATRIRCCPAACRSACPRRPWTAPAGSIWPTPAPGRNTSLPPGNSCPRTNFHTAALGPGRAWAAQAGGPVGLGLACVLSFEQTFEQGCAEWGRTVPSAGPSPGPSAKFEGLFTVLICIPCLEVRVGRRRYRPAGGSGRRSSVHRCRRAGAGSGCGWSRPGSGTSVVARNLRAVSTDLGRRWGAARRRPTVCPTGVRTMWPGRRPVRAAPPPWRSGALPLAG
jgi:hypothetical protein